MILVMEFSGVRYYQLTELVAGEIIGADVLRVIEAGLLDDERENGHNQNDAMQVGGQDKIEFCPQVLPVEGLMEVVSAVRRFRKERGASGGVVTLYASIVPFQLEPNWHAEVIPDAFVVTTVQATEGLSGVVPGVYEAEANDFALTHARTDPEFTDLPSVRIIRPTLHNLIHIPRGALHRSPVPEPETPAEKLIVNITVSPEFM